MFYCFRRLSGSNKEFVFSELCASREAGGEDICLKYVAIFMN